MVIITITGIIGSYAILSIVSNILIVGQCNYNSSNSCFQLLPDYGSIGFIYTASNGPPGGISSGQIIIYEQ